MAGLAECDKRVLSIQSTVVWGYVGNKAATFPLQVHGFDVSPINTVQFSNHTEYGHMKGQVLSDVDLDDLVSGLRTNHILTFSHVLTGYIGCKSFLEKVAEVVKELRANNPKLTYVCDPVMGDHGHLYVPFDMIEPYKDTIVPLADIVTPNQYELELLTETEVTNELDALQAMKILHAKGVKTVVLSSSDFALLHSSSLIALASTQTENGREVYKVTIPKVDATFVGSGDLFAASLLAWLHKDNNNIKSALEKAIATVQSVMARTLVYAQEHTAPGNKPGMAVMELQLVQSKDDIENPKITLEAVKVELP